MKIVGCMCMGADPEPRELYLGYNSTSGPAGQCVIGYRFWTRLWHRVVVVLVKFWCRECWICEVIVTTHLSNLNTTTNLSQQNVRYWYRLNLNFDFHNERSRNSEIFIQKNLIWRLYHHLNQNEIETQTSTHVCQIYFHINISRLCFLDNNIFTILYAQFIIHIIQRSYIKNVKIIFKLISNSNFTKFIQI